MESTSYVFPFRMVFFNLVTTGWILDTSLCENSINQSIKHHAGTPKQKHYESKYTGIFLTIPVPGKKEKISLRVHIFFAFENITRDSIQDANPSMLHFSRLV